MESIGRGTRRGLRSKYRWRRGFSHHAKPGTRQILQAFAERPAGPLRLREGEGLTLFGPVLPGRPSTVEDHVVLHSGEPCLLLDLSRLSDIRRI